MTVTEAPPAADPVAVPTTEPAATTVRPQGDRTDVVVALAQIAPRLGDVAANLERHLELIDEAAGGGASLIVFPELSLTGYFLKDLVPEVALLEQSEQLQRLALASRGVDVVAGCVLESDDARFYNASLYLAGGRVHHVHRKVYLPTYGLFDEARYLAQGDRFRTFAAPLAAAAPPRPWRSGTLICEDMWHPTAAGLLAREGVELFICPSASPGRGVVHGNALGTARSYDAMTRTYAQLFTAYLLYCNRVGFEDGVGFWGGSRAVGPDGRLLEDPAGDDECLVLHRIDLAAVRRARIANPLLRDERHDINDAQTDRLRQRRARD
ncbi:MAG: carbon-nitrogen hydrolase [Candidatus Dormibacteraeota bacterium]|uniref:Carbon-nitrogen hydrolase n=1 Tax=Candidatus Aeolococcus gillhamiae TaxID=3127015 RepID=A0A2W6A3C9_9BACT|nr:carbon-nitrogen hydrolase [Candidatus Dormibacteraeota bacterium]PZR78134.1 MAG: carbon-nitrogen hydrolase [Candidatus Dormibacter sp. RRmetagenome_bin12]